MNYDTAIIGAGPCGLICANELETLGKDCIVLEEDKHIGEPVSCAGLFNKDGLRRLGIKNEGFVLNKVSGARFHDAFGDTSVIEGAEEKAFVVDRSLFDKHLASEFGGELKTECTVKNIFPLVNGYKLESRAGPIAVENLVLATGAKANLHQKVGLDCPNEFVKTSQCELDNVSCEDNLVEIYLGSVAPGFFAWVIPLGEGKARIGLGVIGEGKVHDYMAAFMKRLKEENILKGKEKVLSHTGGTIPVFNPELCPKNGNAYLVGDAAGQVKATTGGGVMLGGLCAKSLASAISGAKSYEEAILPYYKELRSHLLIRRVANKFGDEEYAHMLNFLKDPEVKKTVEENGDMDFTGPLIKGLAKNPMMLMQGLNLAKKVGLGTLLK